MLDPKLIRSDAEGVAEKLKIKKYVLDVAAFEALEEKRKALQVETETLQSERNTRSKGIGKAKQIIDGIANLQAEKANGTNGTRGDRNDTQSINQIGDPTRDSALAKNRVK